MHVRHLSPIAAFDIHPGGNARTFSDPWPSPRPPKEALWRWMHLDLADPGLAEWTLTHLPPVPAAALVQPETRPRCTPTDGGLIVNLRGVNLNPGADAEDMVSLRLWVTSALVVSVRMQKVFAIDDLRQAAEAGEAPPNPGAFLAALAEGLTDRLEAVSLAMDDEADTLEEAILEQDDHDAGGRLGALRRKVIRLRRFTGPQREALARLSEAPAKLIDPDALVLLGESANRATRTVEEIDSVSARLQTLHDHLEAARGNIMARNGYVLSVVAAIFLPLGFLTGLFGVNVAGMPGTQWPWAFAALSLVNLVFAIALLAIFRALKWL